MLVSLNFDKNIERALMKDRKYTQKCTRSLSSLNYVTDELYGALSSLDLSLAHCSIGLVIRFLIQCFLHVHFLRLTPMESEKSDESDE